MERWINNLWQALNRAEWGTEELLGATEDLCNLADCGLVDGKVLDKALDGRCMAELETVWGHRPDRWYHHYNSNRPWQFHEPWHCLAAAEEAAAA